MKDVERDVLNLFVVFAYTGDLDVNCRAELLPGALRLADQYQVDSMVEAVCEQMALGTIPSAPLGR